MTKKWNKIFLLLIISTVVSCSNKRVEKEYYSNGQVKSKIYLENGKLDGEAKFYYKNGQLKFTKKFENGKLNGELKGYYKNGKVKEVGQFNHGQQNGMIKWYYKNGQLKRVNEYKNGKMDGIIKEYYKSGKLKAFEIRKDDSTTRFLQEFEKDGSRIAEKRDIKVKPKYDTLYLGQSHDFTVGTYGPIKNYKKVRVGIYTRNVDSFINPDSVSCCKVMFAVNNIDTRRKEGKELFSFSAKENGIPRVTFFPKKDTIHSIMEKYAQDKDVQFSYETQENGSHRLLGFYQLIPHDTSDFQYRVAHPFSVKFYVKGRPNM
jgi:hypothetical protein